MSENRYYFIILFLLYLCSLFIIGKKIHNLEQEIMMNIGEINILIEREGENDGKL